MAKKRKTTSTAETAPAASEAEEQASIERLDDAIQKAIVGPTPVELATADEPDRGARRRRVERAGFETDHCELLGRPLDAGARARTSDHPIRHGELVLSRIGGAILDAGVTAEELERAAAWLRERGP